VVIFSKILGEAFKNKLKGRRIYSQKRFLGFLESLKKLEEMKGKRGERERVK